jgi:hypothetical protein
MQPTKKLVSRRMESSSVIARMDFPERIPMDLARVSVALGYFLKLTAFVLPGFEFNLGKTFQNKRAFLNFKREDPVTRDETETSRQDIFLITFS